MYNDALAKDGREFKKKKNNIRNVNLFFMYTRYSITPVLRLFKKRQGEGVFCRVLFVYISNLH